MSNFFMNPKICIKRWLIFWKTVHSGAPNFQRIFYHFLWYFAEKVSKLFIFQGFCVELIQIRPFFTTFGRLVTISGQMHVLFGVHFSDFLEKCILGYLSKHFLAQKPCILGYETVICYWIRLENIGRKWHLKYKVYFLEVS